MCEACGGSGEVLCHACINSVHSRSCPRCGGGGWITCTACRPSFRASRPWWWMPALVLGILIIIALLVLVALIVAAG